MGFETHRVFTKGLQEKLRLSTQKPSSSSRFAGAMASLLAFPSEPTGLPRRLVRGPEAPEAMDTLRMTTFFFAGGPFDGTFLETVGGAFTGSSSGFLPTPLPSRAAFTLSFVSITLFKYTWVLSASSSVGRIGLGLAFAFALALGLGGGPGGPGGPGCVGISGKGSGAGGRDPGRSVAFCIADLETERAFACLGAGGGDANRTVSVLSARFPFRPLSGCSSGCCGCPGNTRH